MSEEVSRPEYAAAVGLLVYGARTRRFAGARPTSFIGKLKSYVCGGVRKQRAEIFWRSTG